MYLFYPDPESESKIKSWSAKALYGRSKNLENGSDGRMLLMCMVFDLIQHNQVNKAEELLLLGVADSEYSSWLLIDAITLVSYALGDNNWPVEALDGFINLLRKYNFPITVLRRL